MCIPVCSSLTVIVYKCTSIATHIILNGISTATGYAKIQLRRKARIEEIKSTERSLQYRSEIVKCKERDFCKVYESF